MNLVEFLSHFDTAAVQVINAGLGVRTVNVKLMEPNKVQILIEGSYWALIGNVDVAVYVHANVLDIVGNALGTGAGAYWGVYEIDTQKNGIFTQTLSIFLKQ